MVRIDKNIPIPPPRNGGHDRWPFDQLEPGDSFFIPDKVSKAGKQLASHHSKHGKRFVSRKGEGGTRIWRVS